MTIFSVTYEIVTQESAEAGDAEERGFIGEGLTLREAIEALCDTRTNAVDGVEAIEWSGSHDRRWLTVINGMEFTTGAQESRSLHIPDAVSQATRVRIGQLIGVRP